MRLLDNLVDVSVHVLLLMIHTGLIIGIHDYMYISNNICLVQEAVVGEVAPVERGTSSTNSIPTVRLI